MAVHFGGAMCRIEDLNTICGEHNLFLIEDAAHAQGAEWKGKRAGSFGIAGSFSFQNGKVLCSGEGGMLVTSDADFAERARSIANCGRAPGQDFYSHVRLGTNFRLTAFQAAVLLAQFERLPEQIALRTANANLLKNLLSDMAEIAWQEQPGSITQNPYYLLIGRIKAGSVPRNGFCQRLVAAGVPCTPFYPRTLYQNAVYREAECRVLPCPVAEARIHDSFWLPHRVLLAREETIERVADEIRISLTAEPALNRQ